MNLGSNHISADGGRGGHGALKACGGDGGRGRIRIDYAELIGTVPSYTYTKLKDSTFVVRQYVFVPLQHKLRLINFKRISNRKHLCDMNGVTEPEKIIIKMS